MNQLNPIIQQGQRVLTTQQLADSFGVETKIINRNFQRNAERYIEGKHVFVLSGEELRQFKGSRQFDDSLKFTSILYLWTEKGAWLHAKSLNTDSAWNAYEKLIDEYYSVVKILSEKEQLIASMKITIETSEKVDKIENKIISLEQKIDEQITLTSGEQRRLQKGVAHKVYEFTQDKKEAARLFRELYREIKDRFGVASYKDVRRKELQSALSYIEHWIPRKVS